MNKLVYQYSNTYHHSINKKPINADYSALTEKIETNFKLVNLKLVIESELLSIRIFLVNVTLKSDQEKYLLSNPWTCKFTDINREKIIRSFYEK